MVASSHGFATLILSLAVSKLSKLGKDNEFNIGTKSYNTVSRVISHSGGIIN